MEPETKPREIHLINNHKRKSMVNFRVICRFSIPVWWRRKLTIHVARGDGDVKVRFMFVWCKYYVFGDDRFWGFNKWWFWDWG